MRQPGSRVPLESRTSTSARKVVELDPCRDPRWAAFVDSRPDRLVYHHPQWLEAVAESYGHLPVGLACEGGDGRLLGVLPLCETRGLLSGRRLVSLPNTPIAGPLASEREATGALLRAAVRRVEETRSSQLQIKSQATGLEQLADGLTAQSWSESYVRELPDDPEALRFGPSRNHGRLRWAVNKAAKRGVQAREADSSADLRAWYGLYLDAMRSHAVPPRPYRFFEALWTSLRPRGVVRLLVAEGHQAGRARMLAGSLFLIYGQTIFYAFNGRRRDALDLRPNDLIQWRALHDACKAGLRWYDFGEVERGQQGLAEFKSKWGAKRRILYRYYFPAARELERGVLAEGRRGRELAGALWRRLPLPVTERVGSRLYRYL